MSLSGEVNKLKLDIDKLTEKALDARFLQDILLDKYYHFMRVYPRAYSQKVAVWLHPENFYILYEDRSTDYRRLSTPTSFVGGKAVFLFGPGIHISKEPSCRKDYGFMYTFRKDCKFEQQYSENMDFRLE